MAPGRSNPTFSPTAFAAPLALAFAFALPLTPVGGAAQEWSLHGGIVVPTREDMGQGPLVGGSVILWTNGGPLALRVSGGVAFADALVPLHPTQPPAGSPVATRARAEVALDLSTSLMVRRTTGTLRPFAYGGVGYYRFPIWSEGRPWLYGAGLNAGVGVAVDVRGHQVSLDLGLRSFGGYLAGPSGEMTFSPVTVGFRF